MSGSVDLSLRNLNDCGCCAGVTVETPVEVTNRPGLAAIAYRVGTHALFKKSLLARLSGSDLPALRGLKTRDDDDFSIALLDAWVTTADVLTFYQERIANESYLRTATERLSVLQLGRLIGYELRSGVAASTYLAFTLEDATAPGVPQQTTIDIGTKVQSIPGPGEQPQTFETIERIEARAEWNTLNAKLTELPQPRVTAGALSAYLKGLNTGLKEGDGLLFVGSARQPSKSTSEQWDFRQVTKVSPDTDAGWTLVEWGEGLGAPSTDPAPDAKVYAFRKRAALFGANAPDPVTLPDDVLLNYGQGMASRDPATWVVTRRNEWNFSLQNPINLDASYPTITPSVIAPDGSAIDSWIVLALPSFHYLYKITSVSESSPKLYTLTARTTQLELDSDKFLSPNFKDKLRDVVVFAQSEELEFAKKPLTSLASLLALDDGALSPAEGSQIELDHFVPGLAVGQRLIFSGKAMRVKITGAISSGDKLPDEGNAAFSVLTGDIPRLIESPSLQVDGRIKLHLMDRNGLTGFLTVSPASARLEPANKDDGMVSETVSISSVDTSGTLIIMNPGLQGSYDRTTLVIYGNVAAATNGETINKEVLGSGDASQSYQQFTLKQSPLTYISSSKPSGADSTLEVRVNDLLWHEMPTFFGHGPHERIFVTRTGDDAKMTIEFGDGQTGARLPTGRENVTVRYRKGIGTAGNLKAGQLSLLMTRPLGTKSVINPEAAAGATDRESLHDARSNAPLTVLTLDRIVSLQDYEDFARAFSGVAKALATWTWTGEVRGVFVTVAGPDGASIPYGSATHDNLVTAMKGSGDPYIPLRVQTCRPTFFKLGAAVKLDPDYEPQKVLAAVEQALRSTFSFHARAFGQAVTSSEVMAVVQAVDGVIAVDVTKLYRADDPAGPGTNDLLLAAAPQSGAGALPGSEDDIVLAAELLTLSVEPLDELGIMT